MLTPTFRVTQNGQFVIVIIDLPSIHCRISAAEFDILPDQFTFFCHPYYLRLVFTLPEGCQLAEGKGEKAEYDLATHSLQVFLPKSTAGIEFPNLHMPNMMLATTRQRKKLVNQKNEEAATGKLIQVIGSTKAEGNKKKNGGGSDAEEDGSSSSDDDEDEDLALETEFVQNMSLEKDTSKDGQFYYGFNNEHRGAFTAVISHDNDVGSSNMAEVLELSVARLGVGSPDFVAPVKRRQERLMRETEDFNVEEYWACMEDEDGEVDGLMRTLHQRGRNSADCPNNNGVCWYRGVLEQGLRTSGISFVGGDDQQASNGQGASSNYAVPMDAVEDDEDDANAGVGSAVQGMTSGLVTAWMGNMGKVSTAPLNEENGGGNIALPQGMRANATAADILSRPQQQGGGQKQGDKRPSPPQRQQVAGMLAVPSVTPVIAFTTDEQRMLQFIEPRWNPTTQAIIPPHAMRAVWSMTTTATRDREKQPDIWCVLVDLLLVYVYDHILTFGDGSVESVWTLTKLSPTLSFLDHPRSVYEAVVGFTRRTLTYPLHRHWNVAARCVADVGALLLCGPYAVIRALLSVKHVFDHTEIHHAFNRLYINPYLSFICGCLASTDGSAWVTEQLHRTAVELHAVMTMDTDLVEQIAASGAPAPGHLMVRLTAGFDDPSSAASSSSTTDQQRSALINSMLNVVPTSAGGAVNDRSAGMNGAQQLEPMAPMTIGLPISMNEEEEQFGGDEEQ